MRCMLADTFSPFAHVTGARERGCYTCTFDRGQLSGSHVVCERLEGPSVIGVAHLGCAHWQREPGWDD